MNKHDALRQSEECAYLEERVELLRGALAMLRSGVVFAPNEISKLFIDNVLGADDARRLHWEHSGLNEQPS